MLITAQGMAIRFTEQEVNAMGRVSAGVRGINLKDDDEVIAALWVEGEEGEILVVSDLGYAKRSLLLDYPLQSRGGKGVQTFEFKEGKRVKPNGNMVLGGFHCKESITLYAMAKNGAVLEFSSENAPLSDRKSIGKHVVSLDKQDVIVDLMIKP
ncbi:DNA gyrase subunit A [compost metagenome]